MACRSAAELPGDRGNPRRVQLWLKKWVKGLGGGLGY